MKAFLRTISAIGITALCATSAWPQGALLQGGPWTPGHAPMYVGQGSSQAVVQDSGPAGGGAVGLGMSEGLYVARGTGTAPYAGQGTGPLGTNWCNYDAPTTNPTGYHYLCMSANAQGGGLIVYGAAGGASNLPLTFNINGTTFQPGGTEILGLNNTWTGLNTYTVGPLVPTAAPGTNTTQAASTAFVQQALVASSVVVKTADYTVLNTDNGKTLSLAGNAQFTLTMPAASGFDSNFCVTLSNADVYTGLGTGRGKRLVISGVALPFTWLMPQQSKTVCNQSNAWVVTPFFDRWRVNFNVQLFADDLTGSDTLNDGLSAAAAYKKASTALETVVFAAMDLPFATTTKATINLAAGTMADCVHFAGAPPGTEGRAAIVLNGAGSALTTLNCAGDNAIFTYGTGTIFVQNIKLVSGNSACLSVVDFSNLIVGADVDFGTCPTGHMFVQAGKILLASNYKISGNAAYHSQTVLHGVIHNLATTITCSGALSFTQFAYATQISLQNYSATSFSGCGAVTGQRFQTLYNSNINTQTAIASPTYFPGNVAGFAAFGGLYDTDWGDAAFRGGVAFGSPTGGIPGAGEINVATAIRANNVPGISATTSVRKGDDSGACNLVTVFGLLTSTNC